MNTQIATTIDQSQRLIACGVNPDSADMLHFDNAILELRGLGKIPEYSTPAWSLPALLALLPKHLKNKSGYNAHSFVIEYAHTASPSQWRIAYDGWYNGAVSFYHESPIEACVEAIEWLLKNGYTLNKD